MSSKHGAQLLKTKQTPLYVSVQVTPVLGIIDKVTRDALRSSEAEVAAIFDAPLDLFLRDSRQHRHRDVAWAEGVPYRLHYFEHRQLGQTFNIWVRSSRSRPPVPPTERHASRKGAFLPLIMSHVIKRSGTTAK